MFCDVCQSTATRIALNEKSGQIRSLCKKDSKALPSSDTTRAKMKVIWKVQRIG